MADESVAPPIALTPEEVGHMLEAWLEYPAECLSLEHLTGGCVYNVFEVTFDGPGSPVVLKVAAEPGDEGLGREAQTLSYFAAHTGFPVPRALHADLSGEAVPYSYVILERVPGVNLAEAVGFMTEADALRVEREMAEAVADLHTHTRPAGFGWLHDPQPSRTWAEHFVGMISGNIEANVPVGLLATEELQGCRGLLPGLDRLLPRDVPPTLTHGDIWATNIMVASDGAEAHVSGFLDPGGLFADPEYDLAYLEIWRTVGEPFFEGYTAVHPLREGYQLRRLFYWLNTLLIHVWVFRTERYARATRQLLSQLSDAFGV